MDFTCILKLAFRLSCGLWLGLLILTAGCGKRNPHSAEHAEVSGKVLFKGNPLPGGRITFVATTGSFAASVIIDENGNYKISAPVGDVKIAVDNSMLLVKAKGKGPPKGMKPPRPPGMEAEMGDVKGRFVKIPDHFLSPSTSGLTYTVKPGPQTHNVDLSGGPSSPSGAPGP